MSRPASLFQTLFRPHAIAVIGASRHPRKLGAIVVKNILEAGFRGGVYPVNPHGGTIHGKRIVKSVAALPRGIDLAVVATPATTVPQVVRDCARQGIRTVVVLSSGFREAGATGAAIEEQLRAVIRQYRLRLVGPNCVGVLHGEFHLNASFAPSLPTDGSISIVSQSGATAVALSDWAVREGVGIRAIVSVGNEAGMTTADALQLFVSDAKTKAVVLYLESIRNGEALVKAVARLSATTPVIVLKAGTTDAGRRAAQFHTGALASDASVVAAALRSAGAVQVRTMGELLVAARVFSTLSHPGGNRIAIVTNAGGPGILAADALAALPLTLARLTEKTEGRLRKVLPAVASIANPIDVLGDADPARYTAALRLLLADPNVDAVLALVTPQAMTRPLAVAQTFAALRRRFPQKPLVTSLLGGAKVAKPRRWLCEHNVVTFETPEQAASALSLLWQREQSKPTTRTPNRAKPPVHQTVRHRGIVLPPASHAFLRRAGFRLLPERWTATPAEALRAARMIGYPLVIKQMVAGEIHKTERGRVRVDVRSPAELRKTLSHRVRGSRGWLVQQYVPGRTELFLGAKRDAAFGPIVLLGLGGVDAELLNKTVVLVPPFTVSAVTATLRGSFLAPWLTRRRGKDAVRLSAVAREAARLGALMERTPQLVEVDINPLVADDGKQPVVLDARLRFAER